MELGLSWDDDLFERKEKKAERPKQKPYNVKVCEKQYFFKNPAPQDDIQRQNITKFQADFWYRSGNYVQALQAYLSIQKNPQVKSTTVERDIDESVIRCYLKQGNVLLALASLENLIRKQGEDTSLLLLLAEICSAVGHIRGEITCFKKCISLHSYNHNFWYSLAKAYNKAFVMTANSKANTPNMDTKHIIDSVLQTTNRTKNNYKECLKLSMNCHHCKCTNGMILLDKTLLNEEETFKKELEEIPDEVTKSNLKQKSLTECLKHIPDELKGKLTIQETCSHVEDWSCSAESSKEALNRLISEKLQSEKGTNGFNHYADEMLTKASTNGDKSSLHSSQSILSSQTTDSLKMYSEEKNPKEELSSASAVAKRECPNTRGNCKPLPPKTSDSDTKGSTTIDNEVPYLVVGQEDDDTCSFNMTIIKDPSDDFHGFLATKDRKQCGLSMLAFFCLLRTRFLLQRAIWTSMSFVKEKLSKTMRDVKEDILDCTLCPCGELKKCILKQMELEDASLAGQQVDELDMHSLYQGGRQKHWT